MIGWVDGWMIGWVDGWMTGQMDEMMLHIPTSFTICNVGGVEKK